MNSVENESDFSFIKEFKAGEVYELPSTTNWLQLWKYLTLRLNQSQVWAFSCLGYESVAKQITDNWPKKDVEGIAEGSFEFFSMNDWEFEMAIRPVLLDVIENKREWLIIKESQSFMEKHRQTIQKLAKDFNIKVVVLCK